MTDVTGTSAARVAGNSTAPVAAKRRTDFHGGETCCAPQQRPTAMNGVARHALPQVDLMIGFRTAGNNLGAQHANVSRNVNDSALANE
jgi:hypothetical protein